MARFLRSKKLRAALWIHAGGKCQRCGKPLGADWHADHIVPWSVTKRTNVHEMQALCPECNLNKGDRMAKPRSFFTSCRRIAKSKVETGERWLTALIECGGGKSSLPPAIAYDLDRMNAIESIVWITPRSNLCTQAAMAMNVGSKKTRFVWTDLLGVPPATAARYAINTLDDGNPSIGADLSAGTFGYTCTYDTFNNQLGVHLDYIRANRSLVIADEIQQCKVGSAWGNAVIKAKEASSFFVAMSGDFDRPTATDRVAGVSYRRHRQHNERYEVECDVEYTIYDALKDRAIVKMDFCYGNGEVRFNKDDDQIVIPSIESVKSDNVRDVIRACSSANSQYAMELLKTAVESWRGHRTTGHVAGRTVARQPNAKLLVVCGSQPDAKLARDFLVNYLGVASRECGIAISDDSKAARETLESFASDGGITCCVTVAMAYIGMDVRSITHLCCLTNYRSPAWLHQMLARAWRRSDDVARWEDDYCVCFAPRDPLWQKAIDKIRRAMQIGVKDQDGPKEGPAPGESNTSGHEAKLEYTKSMYEFLCEGIIDDIGEIISEYECEACEEIKPESPRVPSQQELREILLSLNYDSFTVEAMIEASELRPIEDPITDTRLPKEKRKQITQELLAELADIGGKYCRLHGVKIGDAMRLVNGKLKFLLKTEWGESFDREKLNHDPERLQRTISVLVPRVRRIVLGE